jgi:hypothetical protein
MNPDILLFRVSLLWLALLVIGITYVLFTL